MQSKRPLPTMQHFWEKYRVDLPIASDKPPGLMRLAFYVGAFTKLEALAGAPRRDSDVVLECERIIHEYTDRIHADTYETFSVWHAAQTAVRNEISRRDKEANRARPDELWFGPTPAAQRLGWVALLRDECARFLIHPAQKRLADTEPPPRVPDPELEKRIAWMRTPRDLHDRNAWDAYWVNQANDRFTTTNFFDVLFCGQLKAADVFHKFAYRTVLCVGSGASLEPTVLAASGLDVTVLELSPIAIELAQRRTANRPGRPSYIEGDLTDSRLCPGPYDVVLERRTIQLFADDERPVALAALAERVGTRGMFLSHAHNSQVRAGKGVHPARSWFESHGWAIWTPGEHVTERCAWLITSTG